MAKSAPPKTKMINKKKYILFDTQYTEDNAFLAAGIVKSRVPWSDPKIFKSKGTYKEQHSYYIYVREKV